MSFHIVKNAQGEEFVHVIVQKSPALGGRPILQLPAGMWADDDLRESAVSAASRELKEETGYQVKTVRMLTDQFFATSSGMTTELKGFALAHATGQPSGQYREPSEQASIIDTFDVPVTTFTQYDRFIRWIAEMNQKYTISMDILAARALIPPTKAGRKLNVEA